MNDEELADWADDVEFELAQATCSLGGWSYEPPPSADEIAAANKRWALRSYRLDVVDASGWVEHQCGGCRFMAALGADYGICWNERSPMDGMIIFEHGGCLEHSQRMSH